MLSNADLGVVERDDSLGVVGFGVSGNGRFIKFMPPPALRVAERSGQKSIFFVDDDGVGEGVAETLN